MIPQLLLALQASAPAPTAPQDEGAAGPWIPVDGVLAIAGERVVTRQEWERAVDRAQAGRPVETLDQLRELEFEVMRAQVMSLLAAQAGAELDLPTELIDAQLRFRREAETEQRGVTGYRDALESSGIDPLELDRANRDMLLESQWEAFQVGDGNFAGGRPVVDDFIRPGELRTVYMIEREQLAQPTTATLQLLELPAVAAGGQANAEEVGAQIRAELEGGASFAQQVELYSRAYRDTGGVVENVPLDALPPALRTFVDGAEAGALSPVLPLIEPGGDVIGIQIARLVERREGEPPPPFRTPTLQRKLRDAVAAQREARLLEVARLELAQRSYAWIHPAIQASEPRRR